MALHDSAFYVSSVGYAAVTARPQNTAVVAGVVRRQFTAPAVNSERAFVAIVAGTTANTTDATWTLTRGAKSTDGSVTWQECTGHPAVNGDAGSTTASSAVRSANITLGDIIKNNAATHYFICSTAGSASGASEPSYSTTTGATTTDGNVTWTCIGAVGSFAAWGAPHARLVNAYASTWGAAGNKFWVADNHAETSSAGITLGSPASASGGPTYTICVDRTAPLPPVEANFNTGASISNTAATGLSITTVSSQGSSYYQGIAFDGGGGSVGSALLSFGTASAVNYSFKNCRFLMSSTNAGSFIRVGISGATGIAVLWDNCTVQLGATGQTIRLECADFEWRNTPAAIQGATLPTTLFTTIATSGNVVTRCRGVDFSAFSGQLLVSNSSTVPPIVFEDCKFHASMTRYGASNTAGYPATPVIAVRCGSGAADNLQATRDEYSGVQSVDTVITRVGGATDGATPVSHKIVTNAQAALLTPYRMLQLSIDNDTVGANVTVTVYGTINSASLPKNDELWMELQYPGSASSPMAAFKSTGKSHPLAAGASVASDGSSWNGGGSGGGWSPFKLTAVLTSPQPQLPGYIYARVFAGKPSMTCYIDPKPVLS